ncbi:hypothetical protein ILUMI_07711 [Ignelater luminosus]|uniref:C2H2-type domain-containing protein n=1 Tax=Ignelater luminosus TaxID=2038154 RepID=A0A8K0D3C6_IGNLU|nr:hypothetical protein ILUMI_07711 [Ignelater luminosus]
MTMASYSKKRVTKASNKANKNKKDKLIDLKDGNLKIDKLYDINTQDSSILCNKRRGSRCYEILEALGLKRINLSCGSIYNENTEVNNENSPSNLQNSQQDKNNNTKDTEKTKFRKCTKCDLAFTTSLKYYQHRKQHHPRSKILYCKICSKTFRNFELLSKHKRCHSGDRPYCCVQCNKTFESLDLLTAHIRQHAGKLPYTCKICKMGFNLYSDFMEHESEHLLRKSEYLKPKMFKCATCPREFRKLCDLERHRRVHTGEKPYICKICKNRFQQAHNLTKHMIIHTKEKLFKCDICKKEFGRSDVLTRHMITHSVNKPYPCDICDKSFGRFSQLLDHVKKTSFFIVFETFTTKVSMMFKGRYCKCNNKDFDNYYCD